ncbi:MAG: hypothetical protein RLZZ188_249 [Verrucomicrobiota bacterium]
MNGPAHGEEGGDAPRLPGFRTWRGVYLLVVITFVAIVVALALFTRAYA